MPATTPVRRSSSTPARTGRTTPKKAKVKTTFDIDAEMVEEFGETTAPEDMEVVEFGPVFGQMYWILKEMNAFALSGLGEIEEDAAALQRFMLSMVHPVDRVKFKNHLTREINLDVQRLLYVMKRMVEAAAEGNPTTLSSGSGHSSTSTDGNLLSAGD